MGIVYYQPATVNALAEDLLARRPALPRAQDWAIAAGRRT
jgi:hypothetical protein